VATNNPATHPTQPRPRTILLSSNTSMEATSKVIPPNKAHPTTSPSLLGSFPAILLRKVHNQAVRHLSAVAQHTEADEVMDTLPICHGHRMKG